MKDIEIKENIIRYGNEMVKEALTTGTGGNLSFKKADSVFITPSGIDYRDLTLSDIVELDLNGNVINGEKKPSSETEFHLGIYRNRKDVTSIVHTHSTYATVLACLNRELPPIHYLVALAGNKVPVAEYAAFGTRELSEKIIAVLEDYKAVFLANHGLVAMGNSLSEAYSIALNIEFVSKVYVKGLGAGNPVSLSEDRIKAVKEKLDNYLNPYLSMG